MPTMCFRRWGARSSSIEDWLLTTVFSSLSRRYSCFYSTLQFFAVFSRVRRKLTHGLCGRLLDRCGESRLLGARSGQPRQVGEEGRHLERHLFTGGKEGNWLRLHQLDPAAPWIQLDAA